MTQVPAPPSYESARTLHQRARASGLDPDYWYPVALESQLGRGRVIEVQFSSRPIAVYRGADGVVRAVANMCAHRKLKLTDGDVVGCNLVCMYHGWAHDGNGRVVDVPHDRFGHELPRATIATYPVQVRYGLIWLFPGGAPAAQRRPVPELAEPEPSSKWHHFVSDYTFDCHHSIIFDNIFDFTHGYLHRKYQAFGIDAKLTELAAGEDRVELAYKTRMGGGRLGRIVINDRVAKTDAINLCFEYPYEKTDTGGKIKEWCFMAPIDGERTRVFFLFAFAPGVFRVPFLPIRLPRLFLGTFARLANRTNIAPVLRQDKIACEAEQDAYQRNFDQPVPDFNPVVRHVRQLTVRKWEAHLARFTAQPPVDAGNARRRQGPGLGLSVRRAA